MKPVDDKNDFQWALEPLGDCKNVFTACIEGIIGTGKSTLIKRMKETRVVEETLVEMLGHNLIDVVYQLEPVWRWRSPEEGGNGMLADFYENRTANAYPFQVQVFEDYVSVVREALEPYLLGSNDPVREGKPVVLIVERSMFSQLLFWRQQVDDGHTTKTQQWRYMRQWNTWTEYIPPPSLFVLLRIPHDHDKIDEHCDSDERLWRELRRVQRRVQARGRGEEMSKEDQLDQEKKTLKVSIGNQDDEGEPLDEAFMQYNADLLRRHEAYWPNGLANPEDKLLKPVHCYHFDASRPYNVDDAMLRDAVRKMVDYIATEMVLAGYGPSYGKEHAMGNSVHSAPSFPLKTHASRLLVSQSK